MTSGWVDAVVGREGVASLVAIMVNALFSIERSRTKPEEEGVVCHVANLHGDLTSSPPEQ